MKEIASKPENLLQVMYGLLLPAVGGTVFWYLVQHITNGRFLQTLTCVVIVYYFGLHFLAGQQLDPRRYGKMGFALDFVAVVAIEVLFYAVDGLPDNLDLGMVSVFTLLFILTLWNYRTGRQHGLRVSVNHAVLLSCMFFVGVVWLATHLFDVISEHVGMLVSVILMAVASSAYLLVRTSRPIIARAADE